MNLTNINPQTMLRIKKYGYLIFMLPLLLPPVSYFLGHLSAQHTLFAGFSLIVVFGIIPLLDLLLGKDPVNPDEKDVPALSEQTFYRLLTLSCLPLYAVGIFGYAYLLLQWQELSPIAMVLYVMSCGTVGGIIAINVGHELVHKNTKTEQIAGGLLLALVTYAGFKVEHVYGHHVHVSTPEDASSSRYNQGLYAFLPHAYLHNFLNAWKLQKARMQRKGQAFWGPKNELFWYYAVSFGVAGLMGYAFTLWGAEFWMGVAFFFAQSFIAFTLLEIINYIEHYGLHRRKMANGKYERVQPEHSWNSNYFLTNMFLFQLQRHSDHHAFANRRYQVLRHHENSPQLPFGYATMFVIALIPPLWKAIMNPRVEAYYADNNSEMAPQS